MTLEMHVLAWVQTQDVVRLDRLMGFQPPPLDIEISNDYTLYKKKCTDSLPHSPLICLYEILLNIFISRWALLYIFYVPATKWPGHIVLPMSVIPK